MIIHIVGGGPSEFLPPLHHYNGDNVKWVGVDRGALRLLQMGIQPVKVFGDFDSMDAKELKWVQTVLDDVEIWPSEKDKTDMEIALDWASEQNAIKIRVFGATGGRLDHLFGNVQLLVKYIDKPIEIIDRQNTITVHTPGTYPVLHDHHRYISFIPISHEVKGITLRGFKYPLTNCHISIGSTLCISNELIRSSGTFSFSEGILMMIRSKDLGGCF
ncbi:thiamine diphosphokinase [Thermaerobacillus caldiproteolyticus]|uniref:thiamine diphosphokinase n=1 Tax=Thermaerobacillus caldiproteolyticus TaxID=247480 RepID=UPI0018F1ECDE|nr:thiamine diphosphokinase [Anoxybacillus caldiproteolyticus]